MYSCNMLKTNEKFASFRKSGSFSDAADLFGCLLGLITPFFYLKSCCFVFNISRHSFFFIKVYILQGVTRFVCFIVSTTMCLARYMLLVRTTKSEIIIDD